MGDKPQPTLGPKVGDRIHLLSAWPKRPGGGERHRLEAVVTKVHPTGHLDLRATDHHGADLDICRVMHDPTGTKPDHWIEAPP